MADAIIRLHAIDNLVIALTDLPKGATLEGFGLVLPIPVPRGHKIAACLIAKCETQLR